MPTSVQRSEEAPARMLALTGARTLTVNSVWSFAGLLLPSLAAIAFIPPLLRTLGQERFAVLSLVWMTIGYFGFLDFGISRATTKFVAERLAVGADDDIPAIVSASTICLLCFGSVGGALLLVTTPWLVTGVLRVPVALTEETIVCVRILAFSIPLVASGEALRGVLEAHQRHDFVNAVRVPLGISTFLGPYLVCRYSQHLPVLVSVLVMVRALSCATFAVLVARRIGRFSPGAADVLRWVRPLFGFGFWITITNVVNPLVMSTDRLVIARYFSMHELAYYTTPYEAITRLWLIPSALLRVFFPAFAASSAAGSQRLNELFGQSIRWIGLLTLPLSLFAVLFAEDVLKLWLGAAFGAHSAYILQMLAIGVFGHGLAQVAFSGLQAAGRADLTAKVQMIEFPVYVVLMVVLATNFGINGVAVGWTARIIVLAAVLFLLASRTFGSCRSGARVGFVALAAGVTLLATATIVRPLLFKWTLFAATTSVMVLLSRMILFARPERFARGDGP